mgnify:CR=1 FL=1
MSEMNVRKWHDNIISSHFSSKIGHVKIKLETTLVLGYVKPLAVDVDRLVFFTNFTNLANSDLEMIFIGYFANL